VFAVNARTGADAARLLARTTIGLGGTDPHIHDFQTTHFVVDSRSGSAFAGVDGEALELPTPLEFRSHPGGLRIRLPLDSDERLARRRSRDVSLRDLFKVAAGKPISD
jgi:diacylglycerol kinase family enzyme